MVLIYLVETSLDGAAVDQAADDSSKSDTEPTRDQVKDLPLVHSRRPTQVEEVKPEVSMADYIVSSTNHADGKFMSLILLVGGLVYKNEFIISQWR